MDTMSKAALALVMAFIITGCAGFEFKPHPLKGTFERLGLCDYYRSIDVSSLECGIPPRGVSERPFR
jgi:hypothetical protein